MSKCNFFYTFDPLKNLLLNWWLIWNLVFLKVELLRAPQKMLQITFSPQIQQKKSLKWPSNLYRLGYPAEIFGIFYSEWDYQMVNISFSRILKFLNRHGFDKLGWNDPIILWSAISYWKSNCHSPNFEKNQRISLSFRWFPWPISPPFSGHWPLSAFPPENFLKI